jgi:hypothetical protein
MIPFNAPPVVGTELDYMQSESGDAHLEPVSAGSVHIIPPFTAHRRLCRPPLQGGGQ